MADGGEDADFVKRVLSLFVRELAHFYFLECIDLIIDISAHLKHG